MGSTPGGTGALSIWYLSRVFSSWVKVTFPSNDRAAAAGATEVAGGPILSSYSRLVPAGVVPPSLQHRDDPSNCL